MALLVESELMASGRNHTQAGVPVPTFPIDLCPNRTLDTGEVAQIPSGHEAEAKLAKAAPPQIGTQAWHPGWGNFIIFLCSAYSKSKMVTSSG